MTIKRNSLQKLQGMSQLDYLWLNFGDINVANEPSSSPLDNVILSEKAVAALVTQLQTKNGITSLLYDKDPDNPGMMRLTAQAIDGSIVTVIRIPEEVHITSFVGRKITLVDIDNGFDYPINSNVLAITLSNGNKYLVNLDELNLIITGGETNTISTEVIDGVIKSNIKIDKGNNKISAVKLKYTNSGIYTNLELDNEDTGVQLSSDLGKLKAFIPIGTTGYNLKVENLTLAEYLNISKKDPGTVYFITDKPYIYLGTRRYGVNLESGDSPIISLEYNPDTLTLAYKKSDSSDVQYISLNTVSNTLNGMMTKELYIELLTLKAALDGIINVKDYILQQVNTVGISLEYGNIKAKTKELNLKNGFGDVISTIELDRENFLDFAESRKATVDDVVEAAKSDILISEGEQIIILTLTSGSKIYVSVKDLVDTYTAKNSKSINILISSDNEISADLNISNTDKMLYIYNDGVASHIQFIREPGKIVFYGKTRTEDDKLGEFDLSDPKIKTTIVLSATDDTFKEYPPRNVDGIEYDRLTNPLNIGEAYLIECFGNESGDSSLDFRYNDYVSLSPIINNITLSSKEGNILEKDENGYLYASLKLIDV